jgi:hypothetical protein
MKNLLVITFEWNDGSDDRDEYNNDSFSNNDLWLKIYRVPKNNRDSLLYMIL